MPACFYILLSLILFGFCGLGNAQNVEKNSRVALIIGIAEYDSIEAPPLPGVGADMISAKKIASAMGISERNITILMNQEATKANIVKKFSEFSAQAADGGRAFIYFSGHGTRGFDPITKKCYEGLLSYDRQVITHDEIAVVTKKLNDRVDKSIVMFDACHSGGVINNQLQPSRGISKLTPKFYSKASIGELAMCSQPSNFKARGLFENSSRLGAFQENLVFISAAQPDEVSYDEGMNKGGVATQAIRDCLLGSAKDLNESGGVSLSEIQSCAQETVNIKLPGPIYLPHHITIRGNRNLIPVASTAPTLIEVIPVVTPTKPINLNQNIPSASNILEVVKPNYAVPVVTNKPDSTTEIIPNLVEATKPIEVVQSQANKIISDLPSTDKPSLEKPLEQVPTAVIDSLPASIATFKDIESQSNPARKIDVQLVKKELKINKDYLDLKVKSNHDGYLYLVLLGSDKRSFYVLYPNKLDLNNQIKAGKVVNLPSQSWKIKAAGPVGVNTVLVIVSDSPRDLKELGGFGSDSNSPFVYSLNTLEGRSQLIKFLTKSPMGGSEKFAAQIISVEEVQ